MLAGPRRFLQPGGETGALRMPERHRTRFAAIRWQQLAGIQAADIRIAISPRQATHVRTPRCPFLRRDEPFGADSGDHGLPVRDSMYARMSRRTTWEGVESSSAQRRSNTAFLRGSIRMVRRAVRSSTVTIFLCMYGCVSDYNSMHTQ